MQRHKTGWCACEWQVSNVNWKTKKWPFKMATKLRPEFFKVSKTIPQQRDQPRPQEAAGVKSNYGLWAEAACKGMESNDQSFVTYSAGGFQVLSYSGNNIFFLCLICCTVTLELMALLVNKPKSTSLFFHHLKCYTDGFQRMRLLFLMTYSWFTTLC